MRKLLLLALLVSPLSLQAHGGRLDKDGGHWNRATGAYHYHNDQGKGYDPTDVKYQRPRHKGNLDKVWMKANPLVAPYTCRAYENEKSVDIEHIVSFSEARKSGLPQEQAKAFVDDMLNITVAFPDVNRWRKSNKDIANWVPEYNKCWFAHRYKRVKQKYGLALDRLEKEALDGILRQCSVAERNNFSCD